jgi:hypothetical protein
MNRFLWLLQMAAGCTLWHLTVRWMPLAWWGERGLFQWALPLVGFWAFDDGYRNHCNRQPPNGLRK